ncbi:hypothetical protein CYMTET_11974 [Cymbomonas tetramitiformis]|uniref:Uncharacterized protein n=1 Tax=Cymbomonas tetramitiformis TaxID=36881 RepID=A0AAE0GL68_9CHLO|nr:hypothetical protein CYMTET_11974 [Cymbomonas tetramitiformis]
MQRDDVEEVHLIEVAYTWDTRWYKALHEKINKYELLVQTLRRQRYKVLFFRPMTFGATGSLYEHDERALTQHLGLKKKEARALLKSISGEAVGWATKMLIAHDKADKEMVSKINIKNDLENMSTRDPGQLLCTH